MNKKCNYLRHILRIFVIATLIAGFHACDDDDVSSPLTLQYMGVENIGPGMQLQLTPYYKGVTPTDFTIQKVKLNGEETEVNGFAIDTESGVITLLSGNTLVPGIYSLTISCNAGGSLVSFPDVVTVNLLPATPAEIKYAKPIVTFAYGYIDTAFIGEISESVTIEKFVLGEDKVSEYFQIDEKTGTITLNPENKFDEPYPGHYFPTVGIVTPAGTQYYNRIVEFNITSAPLELVYAKNSFEIEQNGTDTSAMPTLKGSADELAYSVTSNPETDKIKIEPSTGRIYIGKDNGLAENDYRLTITATNKYGSKTFADLFTCKVVPFIDPIENFSYADITCHRLKSFTINKAKEFKGGSVTFAFAEQLPKELADLSIDPNTGTISAPQRHKIPMGNYTIRVKATNVKTPEGVVATFSLTIAEHPNYFTLSYGNNLNLPDDGTYASQYTFPKTKQNETISPVVSDPDGVTFKEVKIVSTITNTNNLKVSVNANGKINITMLKGVGAGALTAVIVKATKGEGTEDEYSVTLPVFLQNRANADPFGYAFTPFVMKVNPLKGGESPIELNNEAFISAGKKFRVDFRLDANQTAYVDLSTAEPTVSKTVADCPMLKNYWETNFPQINTTDRTPISCYTKNVLETNPEELAKRLCYFHPETHHMIVNADKWKDAKNKYANGFFWTQTIATTNGNMPDSGNNPELPIVLWFSTDF